MADKEVEELPPSEDEVKSKKGNGGGSLIPVVVIVVLVPVLSYAMMELLFVPRMQKVIEKMGIAISSEGNKDERVAEAAPVEADVGEVQTYDFEDIVANLSGSLHSRYVKVSFTLEGTAIDFSNQIETNKAKLIDAALGILSTLTIMDLEKPGVKNMIRNDLLTAFELALDRELVHQLYFSEFVVQ